MYEDIIEIDARVVPRAAETDDEIKAQEWQEVVGVTKERLLITKHLDPLQIEQDLKKILNKGIFSLSVLLLHSYM